MMHKLNVTWGTMSLELKPEIAFGNAKNPELLRKKLVGTLANEVCEFIRTYKAMGMKGFSKEVCHLRFEGANGITLDTMKLNKNLTAKFKIVNSPKGWKRFATRLAILFTYATAPTRTMTEEQFHAKIDAEIAAAIAEAEKAEA